MQSNQQFRSLISRIISRAATAALAIATVFALTVVLTQSAQAQTLNVLHNFTNGADDVQVVRRTDVACEIKGKRNGLGVRRDREHSRLRGHERERECHCQRDRGRARDGAQK